MIPDREPPESTQASVLHYAPDAFVAADAQGLIITWNARAKAMFGYEADEAIGRTVAELIVPPALRKAHSAGLRRVAGSQTSRLTGTAIELDAVRRDGSTLPIELTLACVQVAGRLQINAFMRDISERRSAQRLLEDRTRQLADAQELANVGSYEWDLRSGRMSLSAQLVSMMGLVVEGGTIAAEDFFALVVPEDRADVDASIALARREGLAEGTHRIVRPDGELRWMHVRRRLLPGPGERLLGVLRDVTDQRAADSAAREADERFRQAFEHAPIGMALVALDGTFVRANESMCELVGYEADELVGTTFQRITHPEDLEEDLALVAALLAGERDDYRMDKRYVHASGRLVWVQLNVSLVRSDGEPVHFIAQVLDISERKAYERELEDRARRDVLTGLLNRRGFEQAVQEQCAAAGRQDALLLIDVDRFKAINDRFGHHAGDDVLKIVAGVLANRLGPDAVIARLGGDEFAAVLIGVPPGDAEQVSASLGALVADRFGPDSRAGGVRISIGSTTLRTAADLDAAMARADRAMYANKRSGSR